MEEMFKNNGIFILLLFYIYILCKSTIAQIFFFVIVAKVLVAGGNSFNVEIFDLINPEFQCICYDQRGGRAFGGKVGVLLQNRPLIGRRSYITEFGGHRKVYNLPEHQQDIVGSASVVLENHSKLWITGCQSRSSSMATKTTTFISLDQPPVEGPNLPFRVLGHCMVQVDEKNIYLISGLQNGTYSNETWIIDPTNNFDIKRGPRLNYPKYKGSCATMTLNQEIYIVVFGAANGIGDNPTVEILNTVSPHNGWEISMCSRTKSSWVFMNTQNALGLEKMICSHVGIPT